MPSPVQIISSRDFISGMWVYEGALGYDKGAPP